MKFKTLLLIASLVLTNLAFSKNQIQLQITSNRVPVVDQTKPQWKWENTCKLRDAEACKKKYYEDLAVEAEKGCKAGDQMSCSNFGSLYVSGFVVEKDYKKAKTIFEAVCKAGETAGCVNLAILYENGWGVEQDYARAEKEYKKYCDMRHDGGCLLLEKLRAKLK